MLVIFLHSTSLHVYLWAFLRYKTGKRQRSPQVARKIPLFNILIIVFSQYFYIALYFVDLYRSARIMSMQITRKSNTQVYSLSFICFSPLQFAFGSKSSFICPSHLSRIIISAKKKNNKNIFKVWKYITLSPISQKHKIHRSGNFYDKQLNYSLEFKNALKTWWIDQYCKIIGGMLWMTV